ncbi:hypothetical protein G6F57_019371 [Rhizopus arrhizus]|nr:hypothetical protein G6F57_019371 [Rhizopus arrhizus]
MHGRKGALEHGHQRFVAVATALCAVELQQSLAERRRLLLGRADRGRLAQVDIAAALASGPRVGHRPLPAVSLEFDGLHRDAIGAGARAQIHRRQDRGVHIRQTGDIQPWRHLGQSVQRVFESAGQGRDRIALVLGQRAVGHVDLHRQAFLAPSQGNLDLGPASRADPQ